jgi:hypothetical protein
MATVQKVEVVVVVVEVADLTLPVNSRQLSTYRSYIWRAVLTLRPESISTHAVA